MIEASVLRLSWKRLQRHVGGRRQGALVTKCTARHALLMHVLRGSSRLRHAQLLERLVEVLRLLLHLLANLHELLSRHVLRGM